MIALLFAGNAAWALDIQEVRFGAHPDKTRMVVELSQQSDFRAFILPPNGSAAYRLIVDLPEFNWRAGAIPKPHKTTVMDVRSGALQPGITRMVIDLEKPAEIRTAFLLPAGSRNPNRLVIDFKTINSNQFNSQQSKVFGTLKVPEIAASSNNIFDALLGNTVNNSQGDNAMVTPPHKPQTGAQETAPNYKTAAPIPPQQTLLRKPLIVIDAGHGGADPGAIGASRSYEKNVTLAAARELKKKLEETGRYRAVLTRDNDTYLKLYKRVSIARHHDADLFISLHADSIGKSNVRGASIYTLSDKASDAQTAKLAARENQVDLIAGVDLSHEDKDVANILIDLAMRDTMNQSKFFANTVVSSMHGHGIRILEKPHRFAGFAVLKAPDIPSVLVEMGFMSNNQEAKLLATRDYQLRIASALTDSIDSYFNKIKQNGVQ